MFQNMFLKSINYGAIKRYERITFSRNFKKAKTMF